MNRHYDRYLTTKYAPLYRDRSAPMNRTAMCWGFEVGDGWFDIVNQLSRLLCSEWLFAKKQYDYLQTRVGKSRYEFGNNHEGKDIVTEADVAEARVTMDEEEARIPVVTQVKEKFGTLRFYTHGTTDEQHAYITFAECMSASTCEVCGARGRRRGHMWVRTRCREHANA